MDHLAHVDQEIEEVLSNIWGYPSLLDEQNNIIKSVLSGRDTLALLPTGGGKSLCYQVPAILSNGMAIVVSPLLALIKDQVYKLNSKGIPVSFLSSELNDNEENKVFEDCKNGNIKLLYISPERLRNKKFTENIREIKLSFLAVDEAHCISEWGNDFRPSYRYIARFREKFPNLTCIALTATASKKVSDEIISNLNLKNVFVVKKSFRRNNLFIEIKNVSDKYSHILYYLRNHCHSGIIYVRTRKETEYLTDFLKKNGLKNVDFYHAGLSFEEKKSKQKNWLSRNDFILITTNAFGMGIDKDNVKFIIHFSPPGSIENYYQEIGRAGRNSRNAEVLLLWNDQELSTIDEIFYSQIPEKKEYEKIISALYSIYRLSPYEIPLGECFPFQQEKIRNITKIPISKISSVLTFLHNQGIISLKSSKGPSSIELKINPSELHFLAEKDRHFVEFLARNIAGIFGRKVFFSEKKLEQKSGVNMDLIEDRLKELIKKDVLDYFDGNDSGIRFILPRDDQSLKGKYWKVFLSVQKNKLRKWEEMKYFLKEENFCKMQLILSYFGEKNNEKCKNCYICRGKNRSLSTKEFQKLIFENLLIAPMTLDEITIRMGYFPKEKILDHLKHLLNEQKIKMLDYRTYKLN